VGPGKVSPGGASSKPSYYVPEVGPETNPDQLDIRAFHAYISSIKLRRLIRDAPDFRTRIKLQRLESNPAAHARKARVDTNKGAREPEEGERGSRGSARRSDDQDRPRDLQTLIPGAYR
jgi:hypothetical protein